MVLRKGFVGFWIVGALGATMLSGCGTLDVHEGYKTVEEKSTEAAPAAESEGLLTSIVSTSGGGTAAVFPIDSPPSDKAPGGPADRVEVYGTEFYPVDGDNHEHRTNVSTSGHHGGDEHEVGNGEVGHGEGGHEETPASGENHEGRPIEEAPATVPQEGVALPEGTGSH